MTAAQLRSPLSKKTKSVLRKFGNAVAFFSILNRYQERAGAVGHRIIQGLPNNWRPKRQPLGVVFFTNLQTRDAAIRSDGMMALVPTDFKLAPIGDIEDLTDINHVDAFCESLFRPDR